MICDCCLTNLEVTLRPDCESELCDKCYRNIMIAQEFGTDSPEFAARDNAEDEDFVTDDDLEAIKLAGEEDWDDLEEWGDDDSDVLDEEWEDYLDAIDNAEHAALYAEDHDYGN